MGDSGCLEIFRNGVLKPHHGFDFYEIRTRQPEVFGCQMIKQLTWQRW